MIGRILIRPRSGRSDSLVAARFYASSAVPCRVLWPGRGPGSCCWSARSGTTSYFLLAIRYLLLPAPS